MRYVSLTAVAVAVSALVPSALLGQIDSTKLSIQGYQVLSEVPYSRTQSYFTYSASLLNTGPAVPAITATVTSRLSSAIVVPGMGNLHFPPAATNTTVNSLNTFTLLVDRTATFGFNALTWSYVAPVANAGPDQTGSVGMTVTLNGSGTTNPSGLGTLTYSWAFASVPGGSVASITNPTSVTPTFVPDVQGAYKITLTASNGAGTDTSTVNVNVNAGPPPPVADAGPNQLVAVGATVHLDGSKSHDFNNKPLTYSWSLIQRPVGSQCRSERSLDRVADLCRRCGGVDQFDRLHRPVGGQRRHQQQPARDSDYHHRPAPAADGQCGSESVGDDGRAGATGWLEIYRRRQHTTYLQVESPDLCPPEAPRS